MTDEPKTYRPGADFEVTIRFDAPLAAGEYPVAFLVGPRDLYEDPSRRQMLATRQTIAPEKIDETAYRLTGKIPPAALPGLYEMHRIDVFYSITGTADAKERYSLPASKLPRYAIIVDMLADEGPPQSRAGVIAIE